MDFAITDDNGFVHRSLTEPETLTAWGVLTNPDSLKKILSESEYNSALEKYRKEFTGTLSLVRIKTLATHGKVELHRTTGRN